MMRFFKSSLAVALCMLPAAAGFAEDKGMRDLSVEQGSAAEVVAPHPGNLSTALAADHPDATYAIDETVRLTLTSNQDAYVTVLDIGPGGETTQLFPNRYQTDNHLIANRTIEIAGAGTGAHIVASGPSGVELIKVITSNKPVSVVPDSQLQGNGPFHVVVGGAKAVVRDLQAISDNLPSPDTVIAFANFALHTVAKHGPVVVVTGNQPPPSHVVIPVDQPFPLLIAADKADYRLGDKPTIVVSTAQACNLTVLEFTAGGVARTIYPTSANPTGALAAQQSVFVAGAPGADLALSGPAGSEQILATCTSPDPSATPAAAAAPSAPGATTDAGTAQKTLSIVAAKPGTAMASVIFNVHP